MTAKWKQMKSYTESKSMYESKFNITKKQAQMILDLKKDELKKMRFLAMLDIDKDEVKQLAKRDPSIMKAIGRQGGSFRTSLVRKRAMGEDAPTVHTGPAIAGTGDDSSTVVVRKKKKKKTNVLIGGDKPMTRLDGRTKAYKLHAQRLQAQRERRQKLKDLGEKFTKKDFRKNEDENEHTKNSYELAQMFGDSSEKRMMTKIYNRTRKVGSGLSKAQSDYVTMIQTKYFRKLKEEIDSKSNKFTKGLKEKFNSFSREEFIVEDNVAILRDIVKRKQAKPIKLKDGQMKVDGYTASAMVQTLDNKKMKPDTKKKLEFIINKGTKSQFLRTVDAVFR